MRILWISPRWPFPADDGAKQASASLLLALAQLGHDIHVVTFERSDSLDPPSTARIQLAAHYRAESRSKLRRVFQAVSTLCNPLPLSAIPFARFGLTWAKLRALLPEAPDLVVIDGNHVYSPFVQEKCPWPMIYRSHNVEYALWEQASEANAFLLRAYFGLQAKRMKRLEANLGKAVHGIAAISPDDAAVYRAWLPEARVEWVPMGFQFSPPVPIAKEPITFGFLGRLDWPPNRDGLEWFLREVWPKVSERRSDARLIIAGSGDAEWLKSYSGFEWLGRLDSVEPFYHRVHAALAPIHYGSGTKIKVVEASRFGRAILATPQALQGSGLSASAMALVSEKASAWIDAMVSFQVAPLEQLGLRAFTEASAAFEAEKAARRFLSLLS